MVDITFNKKNQKIEKVPDICMNVSNNVLSKNAKLLLNFIKFVRELISRKQYVS